MKTIDKELLRTYCVGLLIQELLSRYAASERIGIIQKIYNSVEKKHESFEKQIMEFARKKRKKVSEKTILHTIANRIESDTWTNVVSESISSKKIIINGVVKTLAFREKEQLEKVYKLNYEKVFGQLQVGGGMGIKDGIVNMDSIRFAKELIEETDRLIANIDNEKELSGEIATP